MKRYDDVSIMLQDYDYDAGDDSISYTDHDHEYDTWLICTWMDGWMNGQSVLKRMDSNENDVNDLKKMKAMMMITHEDDDNHT